MDNRNFEKDMEAFNIMLGIKFCVKDIVSFTEEKIDIKYTERKYTQYIENTETADLTKSALFVTTPNPLLKRSRSH